MNVKGVIISFLSSVVVHLPMLLVWAGGAVAAVVRRRHHPRVSMLVLGACAALIVLGLGRISLNTALPMLYEHVGIMTVSWILTGIGIGESVLAAAANGLLIFAAFSDRPAEPQGAG